MGQIEACTRNLPHYFVAVGRERIDKFLRRIARRVMDNMSETVTST